ncbi:MAG: DUF4115 domain-containing protein [Comamonas sp.]|jgi:cytoskeleton protein RodZ|uniref:RodZ domain-containing protein n=1 Tax=Comamonas sp. TaxID=34028 RepID=UPI00282CC412|nr:RodZ domain-containing protein [Comamonas sp.]MDR0215050.1 DUF4115 domain-containing protein [Comamonas sp.]
MQSEEQAQIQTSAGAILRQTREAARMQLPTMAAMLKVPQHKLEALEADHYDAFPDHVFMRALAMGMCRNLHIDAEPVLALLPRTALKSLGSAGGGINETVKERSHFKSSGPSFDSRDGSSRKIIAGVLLLLAAAAAVYFVPFHQASDDSVEAPSSQVTEAPEVAQAPASGVVVETGSVVIPSETPAEAVAPLPSAPAANEAASTAAASAAAAPAEAVATAATGPAADAGSASVVEFKASAQSWVKVKDASGKVVLEKTLAKDQSVTAEGKLPLSVIVGNAKGTQVLVHGQPFDISTTRDNVARFEVK